MHLVAGLDSPTSGEIFVDGLALHTADDAALTDYRRRRLGVVFQFFNLLPTMSVIENVALPLLLQGVSFGESQSRARELLELVGMQERATHFVHQLSGGEQQRTAIARALATDPAVLLADEPSGNLDHMNAEKLHALFAELARDLELGMVVVTHNRSLAARADRALLLEDGRLIDTDVGEVVT